MKCQLLCHYSIASLALFTFVDADLMNTTFAFLLRVLGEGVDAAHSLSPPSVTAAALVALGNLLEGALTQPGLW